MGSNTVITYTTVKDATDEANIDERAVIGNQIKVLEDRKKELDQAILNSPTLQIRQVKAASTKNGSKVNYYEGNLIWVESLEAKLKIEKLKESLKPFKGTLKTESGEEPEIVQQRGSEYVKVTAGAVAVKVTPRKDGIISTVSVIQ